MNNKQSTRGQHFKRRFLPLLLAACYGVAQAAPTAPQVVAGQASFVQQGNVFSITNTPNTIINWQSFSVNAGEITRFLQQDANSAVLNRIVGQDPSQILGALQSNGRVFVINPNGILFGRDAKVDVAGLTASTLQLSDADFLAGRKNFTAGAATGKLTNEGAISAAPGGQVFLIAGDVENSGMVRAPDGQVVLAAGHSVRLVDSANPDVQVVVSAPNARAVNLGQVIAQGGKIGIYGALVSQRGTVSADSAVVGANGKIVLRASRDAVLEAGSVTSATGAGQGGTVHLLGERVALDGDARIDASGAAGGGTVLVGGDYQGKNAQLPNAQHTWMGKDASIKADATASGKGGKVVLWSDGATQAYGNISVRGGAAGGDGGLIETSGKTLAVSGARVDASAAKGANGTWLLDPDNIIINTSGGDALPGSGTVLFSYLPTQSMTITPADIAGASADVVLQAVIDITVSSPLTITTGKSVTLTAGNNITIGAAITSDASLTLEADNNISIDAPIWLNGTNGIMTIKGDKDNNATGDVVVNGSLITDSGTLEMTGNNITIDTGGAVDLDGSMTFKARDTFTLSTGRIIDGSSEKYIQANKIAINGAITGGGDVHIGPELPERGIDINTSKPGSALEITPAELNKIEAQNLYLGGDWMTGAIKVTSAFAPASGKASALYLHTQGQIDVIGDIDMTANTATTTSYLELARFGSATGRINVTGALKTFTATIESNNINLAGTLVTTNGSGGSGYVYLGTQRTNASSSAGTGAAIQIGASAVEASSTLALTQAQLLNITADELSIGTPYDDSSGKLTVAGALDLSTVLGANSPLFLRAGGAMAINGALKSGGEINLSAGGALTQTGTITGTTLQFDAASATLNQANMVDTISGATAGDFSFKNGKALTVGAAGDRFGIANDGGAGKITLNVAGLLTVNDVIDAGGSVSLTAAGITGDALISAPGRIDLASTAGIGTLGGALRTSTSNLSAINTLANGSAPIKISNTGLLNLNKVAQVGAGNVGIIDITTTTGMVVRATDSTSGAAAGVQSVNGDIFLVTNSPMTLDGPVSSSGGGAINLTANNAGVITINSTSALTTTTGDISLTGDSIVHDGAITSGSGNVTFNAAPTSISGAGTVSTAGTIVGYTPPAPPTLAACVANTTLPGCTTVLAAGLEACIANPDGALCSAILPSVASCIANPATTGCSVVLPTLANCIANPATAGCSVVLPAISTCIANPATEGCSVVLPSVSTCVANPGTLGCTVVLPTLSQCIASPTTAGCSVVLPSLSNCTSNPATPGCSVVLPTLDSCIANPAAAGCSVVLPSLPSCLTTPTTAGCSVVLPSIATCVANPAATGCSVVLPSIATCVANPAANGCIAVLPTLTQCVATPTAAGCSVVLPSLASCITTPTAAGCSAVLPTLAQCIVTPTAAGCSVILPSLQSCIATPTAVGCSVVLPSLSTCVANPAATGCLAVLPPLSACIAAPSTAGCSAVLPTLAQCTATPTLAGCSMVLPPVSACVTNPSAPGCTVVLPTPDTCTVSPNSALCQVLAPPVAETANPINIGSNEVVRLINTSAASTLPPSPASAEGSDEKRASKVDLAAKDDVKTDTTKPGAKDVQKKTYCN